MEKSMSKTVYLLVTLTLMEYFHSHSAGHGEVLISALRSRVYMVTRYTEDNMIRWIVGMEKAHLINGQDWDNRLIPILFQTFTCKMVTISA